MIPKVFIIILNWNGWFDTKECLASLGKVNYDNFEVILIDNNSRQPIPSVSAIPDFRNLKITQIFNKENLGFAGGNNQGIKIALENNAEYILLLNNDTIVEPDFLGKLVAAVQEDEEAGIAGPLIYFYNGQLEDDLRLIWSAGGKITHYFTRGELIGYGQTDEEEYQAIEQVDYISGTCLLIKAEVIKKIGFISQEYFLYYEDADWCLKARQAGWRCLVVPSAKIYHKVSRSTQEFSFPYIYYHSRNGLIFAEHFGLKILTYLISIWLFTKQAVKMIIGYKRHWARPVMKGIIDFWQNKKGKLEGYY